MIVCVVVVVFVVAVVVVGGAFVEVVVVVGAFVEVVGVAVICDSVVFQAYSNKVLCWLPGIHLCKVLLAFLSVSNFDGAFFDRLINTTSIQKFSTFFYHAKQQTT